jgi:aminotransferase
MSVSKSLRSRIAESVRDIPRSGIRDFFDIVAQRDDVISLGVGEPDFITPWKIREASIFALEHGATSYTANLGLPSLRRSIAKYLKRKIGVEYAAENEILVTVGVSEALDLAIRALIEPGDEVLYHEPCYVSYMPLVRFAGGVPVAVETQAEDGFRLTRAALEDKVTARTKLLIINFPNNPTGATMNLEQLQPIADFVIEHDLIVITDEVYCELTYDGAHVSIASLPGMKERTIYLHGFSKAWAMTGFRLGFSCAPVELTEAMMKIHQYTMLCAPIISQKAAIEALESGDQDVVKMCAEYNKRRNFMHASLMEVGLACCKPEGAFYMMPYIGNFGLSSKEFALRLLEEESVAVVPGSAFGACGEGFIRCCYATSFDEIKEAMIRIARFVKKLSAGK